ncbi:MAG: hypothetical protein NC826_06430 [Candidatus Omnitrophica bacterium]|nr:hypothetical protein [Candidatus Omnitrophota bacterium]
MERKLKFLKISSLIIKAVAWFLLSAGIISGLATISGILSSYPRHIGVAIILFYCFSFLFFYTVAIIADILIDIKKKED